MYGDAHATKAPASRLHWKLEPALLDLNVNVAVRTDASTTTGGPLVKQSARPTTEIPFIANFPRRMEKGAPGELIVCGKPGAAYTAIADDGAASKIVNVSSVLSAECEVKAFSAPAQAGSLAWAFTYQSKAIPGADVNAVDGSGDLPLVTTVTGGSLSKSGYFANDVESGVAFGVVSVPP